MPYVGTATLSQTSSHLLTDCEVFCHERAEIFNTHFQSKTEPAWRPHQLTSFLRLDSITELENDGQALSVMDSTDTIEHQTSNDNNSTNSQDVISLADGTDVGSST